jgi:hypothetical protein
MDFLFGEGQNGLRILLAIFVVLALIGLVGWLVRRFGSERLWAASTRSRQPRLAVIDAATVDGRRRLLLIRRDNVEHLLMIGGPTDIVIEPNILRAAAARDTAPLRAPGVAEAIPRPETPSEGIAARSPQHDPVPTPRPQRLLAVTEEPVLRQAETETFSSPPLRPQRQRPVTEEPVLRQAETETLSPLRPQRQRPVTEEPAARQAETEPLSPPPLHPQRQRPVAEEPALRQAETETFSSPPLRPQRQRPVTEEPALRQAEAESLSPPPRALRAREPAREPLPLRAPPQPPSVSPGAPFAAAAEQNLTDMAQRLEAALRRSPKPDAMAEPTADPRSRTPSAAAITAVPPGPEPPQEAALEREATLTPAVGAETGLVRNETKPRESNGLGPKTSAYDSLEQEMASLLGRPPKS